MRPIFSSMNRRFFLLIFWIALLQACLDRTSSDGELRDLIDDLGRQISVPRKVERVVSLAPSLTEIIFAVNAEEKLVGVTTFCDFPEEAKKIEKVGDTIRPNMEKIVALKPDIVFVSTASQLEGFTKSLEQNGVRVYVTHPRNLESIFHDIEVIGEILDRSEQANQLVMKLKERVSTVENKTKFLPKPKVFVQIDKSLFTVGRDSFITDLIVKAGGMSVTANVDSAYPKLSKETALALNPDVIILTDSYDNDEPNEVFINSEAVRKGRVFKINSDVLSRPGPRIVDALEQLAEVIHK
ncbi:MAG: cobalamin-binding protein [Acidobacteria bacterium]|nr:MAG: cobalamin-binding protein [Acidobacteriota bacterium]